MPNEEVEWLPEAVKEKLRFYIENGAPTHELEELCKQSLKLIEKQEKRLSGR